VPPAAGAAYWGPGYVGWVVTPAYVAWVPLAPGEVYYGYGNYGPGSVNVGVVGVNTVAVRSYTNARIGTAVTVVQRESFGTGRRVPAPDQGNPFLSPGRRVAREETVVPPHVRPQQPIVIVEPGMRQSIREAQRPPERERRREFTGPGHEAPLAAPSSPAPVRRERTEQPAVIQQQPQRPLPAPQLPPARVRSIQPEAVKKERPLVRQRESSVFTPQPPQNLPVRKSIEPRVINRQPTPAPQQGAQPQKKQGEQREERREQRGRE